MLCFLPKYFVSKTCRELVLLINFNLFITGAEVPKQKPVYHKKIDLMKLDHALDFIFNPAFHQVSSVGTKEMRLEDGSVVSIPEVVRTVWHSTLIKLYLAYYVEKNITYGLLLMELK